MDINRKTAYKVLLDIEKNQSYSNLALNNFINQNRPDNPAFVRELVYGVLENKILLDYALATLIPSGLKKVKKQDLVVLRMGIYQLEFMNSVPEYAAVNESVNLAKAFCRGRDGFINGVLRGFLKKGKMPELPDREKDLAEFFRVKYSIEKWIVELWMEAYGNVETEQILDAINGAPGLSLRANLLKTTTQELIGLLEQEDFKVVAGEYSDRAIMVKEKATGILETKLFRDGYFSVQDEASMLVADLLHPQPGNLVIDVCAAPGGKTLAMAEKMGSNGKIYAFDIYEHKLELIHKQAERLGVNIIETQCHDGTDVFTPLASKADCVLADVPCSGLGVLRRKPEIKYKGNEELDELVKRQQKILQAASSYVKKGGALVYSTCTINPAENEEQVNLFLRNNKDFELVMMKQLLPGEGTDGFFISRMIRE